MSKRKARPEQRRRVVVTGAAGYIFSRMMDAFRERYELTLLDANPRRRDGTEIPDVNIVDLTDRNRDAYREFFRGADAVLHCAFIGGTSGSFVVGATPESRSRKFQNELLNVQMAYNIYQVLVEENVRRVVVCSRAPTRTVRRWPVCASVRMLDTARPEMAAA